MSVLASLKNPRVAYARKLSRKRTRDAERAFVIEGPHAIREALDAGASIKDGFVTEEALGALPSGFDATIVSSQVMAAICDTETPQGMAAIVEMVDVGIESLAPPLDLALVLAEVRDPGNAGTMLRSARAAGAQAVIFTRGCVDPFSPKTVRASAGAIFGPQIVRDADPQETIGALRLKGLSTLGAVATADTVVFDLDLTEPTAIVVGNEAWGLPPEMEAALDRRAAIPMPGPAESLNAAVAGSLLLFEAVRQRREGAS